MTSKGVAEAADTGFRMSVMRERRSIYREQQGLDEVKISMAWPGHDYVAGQLIDLSARGAAVSVSVPSSQVPALPVGSSVYLCFETAGLEPISDIVASISNERDVSGTRVFGLEIIDWSGLHDRLPPKLFSLFNRRQHYRVAVPRQPPVEVDVSQHPSGRKLTAHLSNISAGGCLLLFELEDAPQKGDKLELQFRLPDSEYRYNLSGVCMSAFEFGESDICGIGFESSQSEAFVTQQQRISHYVMDRQRELLPGG